MLSVEELIRVLCPEYMGDEDAAALIRARDRDIAEACKKAIINIEPTPYSRLHIQWGEDIKAIDSVLRDLG